MPLLFRIKKVFLRHFMDLRWYSIVLACAFYIIMSWGLLQLAGEQALLNGADFIYWIIVTASTVGYGDFSPTTAAGKYIVSLFVIPFGLGLFGLAVGRLAAFVSFQWRKGLRGLKTLDYTGHILIMGWNNDRTLQLIRLLLREIEYHHETQRVALCVKADIENPLPDEIGFIRVSSFNNDEQMSRAALKQASCIIIDNPEDDLTMTTALYCSDQNPDAHIIAYFKEESLGKLLKAHCPNVECMPSVAIEMLAKSAMDPGSSALHHQLLDVHSGMTQYSMPFGASKTVTVRDLFLTLKEQYAATLIGISSQGYDAIELNPALDQSVAPGSTLYYIADERINQLNWDTF